jgi:type IV pilus assembly protein PilC
MANFTWKGRDRGGNVKDGIMAADNNTAVISSLRKQQILVTEVKEKGKELKLPLFGKGVSQKEIAIFTRQFSVMIDAGLPLVQCLEVLAMQQENRAFQRALNGVRQDVESGSSLADALRKHEKVFNNLYCNMVAAGESGGILDTILQRLADYIEKSVKLKKRINSAMIYPISVISIAVVVVIIILWKVIPTFDTLFKGLDAELPLPTRIVVVMSNFVGRYIVFLIAGFIAAMIGLKRYHKTYRGRRVLDGLALKMPVMGMLIRKISVARFCRTQGTLISSGVPILEALEITARTAGNAVVEDAIMVTRKSIEGGKTIAEPLKETDVFPPMVVQMIAVGEQTGALDAMLSKIADFYEEEVDVAVDNLVSLLEPIMIFVLGTIIGGIVVAMYMPLFSLMSKIG